MNEAAFAKNQAFKVSALLTSCKVLTMNRSHKYHLFIMHANGGCDDDILLLCKSLGRKLAAWGLP
jgi:hypothetical protein